MASVLSFPYPFVIEINKVIVFTSNPSKIKIAEEIRAVFTKGTNLIQRILDDEIHAGFYVAIPEITPEVKPLKKKFLKIHIFKVYLRFYWL